MRFWKSAAKSRSGLAADDSNWPTQRDLDELAAPLSTDERLDTIEIQLGDLQASIDSLKLLLWAVVILLAVHFFWR
jgi:hypothetical protein